MTPEYRKIIVEFVYYDKNIDRSVYNVKLLDIDDEAVYDGNVYEKDVAEIVGTFMSRDMKY